MAILDLHAEFLDDTFEVAHGEVELDVVRVEIIDRRLVDHVDEAEQLPPSLQHRGVDVTVRHSEVQPHLLRDSVEMSVQERLVRKGVRSPEFDSGTIAARAPDLPEQMVRAVDVLEEVRREDFVDRVIREWERVNGEVEHVVDRGPGH